MWAKGRPPLALGTHGAIRCYDTGNGYRARTLARDYDGHTRDVERSGRSKAAAERALNLALRDRDRMQGDAGGIRPASLVSQLAEAWYSGLADLAPSTMQ
ncbi:MAG: site-specific integrase, partial [Mycobacteriales bacterium]